MKFIDKIFGRQQSTTNIGNASPEISLYPPKSYRIENIEDFEGLPTPLSVLEDPNWLGNEGNVLLNEFIEYWVRHGRSQEILRKLLENTHFI